MKNMEQSYDKLAKLIAPPVKITWMSYVEEATFPSPNNHVSEGTVLVWNKRWY